MRGVEATIEHLNQLDNSNKRMKEVQLAVDELNAKLEAFSLQQQYGQKLLSRLHTVEDIVNYFDCAINNKGIRLYTSNDFFNLKNQPQKVLVLGGGYIAVEFAGILNGLGSDVSLVIRKEKILRGFENKNLMELTKTYKAIIHDCFTNLFHSVCSWLSKR